MKESQENNVTLFARTNFHNAGKLFGIRRADRRFHLYAIGKTGTGKSTLLETLIRSDLLAGEGVAVFDPHGELVEKALHAVPEERRGDLLYLNLPDPAQPYRFNPLSGVPEDKHPVAAANLVEIFRKIWPDSWGPRLEHVIRHAFLALLDYPGGTIADIERLFSDSAFRARVARELRNEEVRKFWLREWERYPFPMRLQMTAPISNKVGAFLSDPRIFRLLASPGKSIQIRELMDQRGILLVNLSKGEVGEGPAALIGALLVASIGLSGLSRTDQDPEKRTDFYVYLDEFQTFATLSLAGMLSELRKYRVNLTLVHQYLSQVDVSVRDAILGNVGTIVSFRVGAQDVNLLAREFSPEFTQEDLLRLPNLNVYLKLMVDGTVSRPFSAEILLPPGRND